MKISASIYSNREKSLEVLINELDAYKIDYYHIDCLDNPAVFDDIRAIKKISKTPIDLHIITSTPEKYFTLIEETGTEMVTFQYENLQNGIYIPKHLSSRFGLAITSETSVDVFKAYQDCCSFILFMTTVPGQSGGLFNKENFRKIRKFSKMFPGKKIHVDGGVNEEVSFILRNMGVSAAVSGSYLLNASFMGAALLDLKSDNISSHYTIRDFMIDKPELPVLVSGEFCFKDVLQTIEDFNYGFALVTDKNGKFEGIITNADVRKALLKNFNTIDKILPGNLINTDPAFIHEYKTLSEMLRLVKNLRFPVLFLPVINSKNQLTGAITFNNLIKGEL